MYTESKKKGGEGGNAVLPAPVSYATCSWPI